MDLGTIIYLGGSGVIILIVVSGAGNYGSFGLPVAIIGTLVFTLLLVLNFADFLVFPFVTNYLDMGIVLSKDHRVPKKQNSVMKYVNGLHYATGYLTANVYKYVFASEAAENEGEEEGLSEGPDKWEGIVMNTKFPFKFNVISSAEDVQKYREDLEGQRGFLEFQLSKENGATNPNQLTIIDLQRKISVVQARIDRISQGELPIYSVMYIETTAVGVSEKEAQDLLTEQINHLQTVFNAFDLSISRIVGRELHTLFGVNYRLLSLDEMMQVFELQN